MYLKEHDTPTTQYGIATTPVPRLDFTTNRRAILSIKRYQNWLLDNTLRIAKRLQHDHITILFHNETPGKFPPATIDSLCDYLGLTLDEVKL